LRVIAFLSVDGRQPDLRAAFLVPQTVAMAMALSGAEPARNAQRPNWFQMGL